MHATALIFLALGLVGIVLGARIYTDPRYERLLRRRSIRGIRLLKFGPGPGMPIMYVLDGFGLCLIGVVLLFGENRFTKALLLAACVPIALGLILFIFPPKRLWPKWMRPDIQS